MNTPFPGMDPWLEHPILWPDVHNRLIAALADVIAPLVAPRYFVRLERRVYMVAPGDAELAGIPDLNILRERLFPYAPVAPAAPGVYVVDLPVAEEVEIGYLAVYAVDEPTKERWLVTVIEVLSPVNKVSKDGRKQYLEKRAELLGNRTSLVEIDLLRAGEPLPMTGDAPRSDYRVVVARELSPLAATGDGVILVAGGRFVSVEVAARTVLHEVLGHALPSSRAPKSPDDAAPRAPGSRFARSPCLAGSVARAGRVGARIDRRQ